jgi:hypothetical protein
MSNERLSEDDDVAAMQVLGMGATRYATKIIVAAFGTLPPRSDAVAALDRARKTATAARNGPAMDALRNLQMAAVAFTVQLATSYDLGDSAVLQSLYDKLIATLDGAGAALAFQIHDDTAATQILCDRALDYERQILVAEDNGVPVGLEPKMDLEIAAVTFTAQLAISEGHDPEALRQIEKKLVEMLTCQGGS